MVAVVSGSGLGLFSSSATALGGAGATGNSNIGRGRDQVYVNSTTGNVVVQSADEILTRIGLNVAVSRTYNSQGQVDGDNDDGWRMGVYRRVQLVSGTLNGSGSTASKTFGDGSVVLYTYDNASGLYKSTDGDGAHDTLRFDAAVTQWWTWTDGSSQGTESYDTQGVLRSAQDADGNSHTFIYNANGTLQRIDVSSGQWIAFTYGGPTGKNLASVTVNADGGQQTVTRYFYDSANRLRQTVVDLTYLDNSAPTADINGDNLIDAVPNETYVTTYDYEGTSTRILRISQSDNSSVAFSYVQLGGEYRLSTVTDAEGRVTRFEYSDSIVIGGPPPTSLPPIPSSVSTQLTQPVTTDHTLNTSLLAPGWTMNLNGQLVRSQVTMPAWPAETLLETNNATAASEPSIAFDAQGNGWAVWAQGADVFARRYTASNDTWAAAFTVDSGTNTVTTPRLAIDESGNTIVAWVQSNGAQSAFVRRWDGTTQTWGAVTTLESNSNAVATTSGSISVSAISGRAVVSWIQAASSVNSVYAARWTGSAWSTAQLLETSAQPAAQQDAAVDVAGNIIVVWQQSVSSAASIYMARYTASSNTWGAATLVENTNTAASDPKVVMSPNTGNAVIVWNQQGARARVYNASTQVLGAESQLNSIGSGITASAFSVTSDFGGRFLVAFVQANGSNRDLMVSGYNESSQAWEGMGSFVSSTQLVTTAGAVVIRNMGNDRAAIAWLQSDGTRNNLFMSRYLGRTSTGLPVWGPATLVEAGNNAAAQPALAIDSNNNVAAVWQQSISSQNSIYTNRYAATLLPRYTVVTNDTWPIIATKLYGVASLDAAAAGEALRIATGSPALTVGNPVTNLPLTLPYTRQIPPSYGIPAGATWRSLAATLYGPTADYVEAGTQLSSYFPGLQLLEGNTLFGPPATLTATRNVTTTVAAYYLVTSASVSWSDIVNAVYGTTDANAVARFIEQVGGSITVGRRITVPQPLTYTPATGGTTLYRRTDVYDANIPATTYTTYIKDDKGQLKSILEPAINGVRDETRFDYDPLTGDVIRVTVEMGATDRVTDFGYDARGNLTLTRDSVGNTVTRSYDIKNQLTSETTWLVPDPDGAGNLAPSQPQTTNYVYGSNNRLRFVISPKNEVTEHRYDGSGQRTATLVYFDTTYTAGVWTETALQGWVSGGGRDLRKTQRTDFSYDPRGNLFSATSYTEADTTGAGTGTASITRFAYDQRGRLLQSIEARGSALNPDPAVPTRPYSTNYMYDGLGRLKTTTRWVSSTNTSRSVEVNLYDDAGQRVVTTLANGLTKTATFDRAGQLIHIAEGPGDFGRTEFTYDSRGRLRVTRDPIGVYQYDFYDDDGRRIGTVDGDGSVTEYFYNRADDIVKTVHYAVRLGTTTLGNLVAGWNTTSFATLRTEANNLPLGAENKVTRVVYDAAGAVRFKIDAMGYATQFFRDGAGQATGSTSYVVAATLLSTADVLTPADVVVNDNDTNNRRTRNLYDANGRLAATLDAEGYVVEFTYDLAGRLTRKYSYANKTSAGSPYTADLGALRPALDEWPNTDTDSATDIICRYYYDNAGRQVAELDGEGYLNETVYDVAGRVARTLRYAYQFDTRNVSDTTTLADLKLSLTSSTLVAQTVRYEYDGAGQVTRTIEGFGTGWTNPNAAPVEADQVTTFTFNNAGQLIETTRGAGSTDERISGIRYDSHGRVSAELSAVGRALITGTSTPAEIETIWTDYGTSYTYDNANRRISSTQREAGTSALLKTFYYYDADGRLQFIVDPRGHVAESVYDAFGQVTDVTDHYVALPSNVLTGLTGGVATAALAGTLRSTANATIDGNTHSVYDARGLVKQSSTAAGNRTDLTYTAFGEVDTSTQRINATLSQSLLTKYFYDKRGQLTKTQADPTGIFVEEKRDYDAFGRLVTVTDPRNIASGIEYDRLGRQIVTVDAIGGRRSTAYDAFSRVTEVRDATAAHNITGYVYNNDTRSVTITTPEKISVTSVYNRYGEQVRFITPTNITIYDYYKDGQLKSVSDSLGTLESRTYDSLGRAATSTDALNTRTTFSYDVSNRTLSRMVDSVPTGQRLLTTYSYDPNARILDITEPGGLLTRTEYDADGRVKYVTVDPTGAQRTRTEYQYDDANNAVLVIEGQLASANTLVRTTRNDYDVLGRLKQKVVDPSGLNLITQYRYDKAGNLTRKIDAENKSTWFVYDAANRLTQTIDALGGVTELAYDAENRVTETRRYSNSISVAGFAGTDELGAQTVTKSVLDRVTRSVYDLDGRERFTLAVSQATGSPGSMTETAIVTERAFDHNGNVTRTRIYRNAITVPATRDMASVAVALKTAGNDVAALHAEDRVERKGYDARGRLEVSVDATGASTRYEYDAAGNITKRTEYAAQLAPDGAMRVWFVPTTNSSASRYLGNFNAGDVVTATVRFKASPDTTGAMFLGDAGGPNPYDNAQYTGIVYGNDGWLTLTLTQTMSHADDMWIYLYGDRDGPGANATHSVLYDNVQVTSVQRGAVLTDNFDGTVGSWSASGSVQSVTVMPAEAGGDAMLRAQVTALASANDHVTRFWYDSLGRVRFSLDAENYLKETRYLDATRETVDIAYATALTGLAANPDITAISNARVFDAAHDHATTTLRDAAGRIEKVTQVDDYNNDAIAATTVYEQYTYDGVGNKRSFRNAKGDVWTYDYDANGRLSAEFSPQVWVTTVSASGENLTAAPPELVSIVTRLTYDNLGNVKTRIEGIRRTGTTDNTAGSRTTTYGYDALGRQTSVTHPQAMVYSAPAGDANNVGTGTQLQEVAVTPVSTTTYNALGDAVMNVDVSGAISRKAYDELGRAKFEIDALGYVIRFGYDVFGNQIELTRFAKSAYTNNDLATTGALTVAQFEGFVGPLSSDTANFRKIATEYDRLNRRIRVVEPSSYTYTPGAIDTIGTRISAAAETRFSYDAFGQVTLERRLLDATTQDYADTYYFYDKDGKRRHTVDDLGYVTEDKFDAFGNVTAHIEYVTALTGSAPWNPAGVVPVTHNEAHPNGLDRKTDYQYDSLGRMRRQRIYEVEYATGTGAATSTQWGIQQSDFGYDALGNRTSATDHYGSTTYTYYDVLGRIRAIAEPPRKADTNGDYVVESTDVIPLTEINRDAFGDVVEQKKYGSSATGVSATGYTAPTGGPVQVTRMLLDNYGRVKRTQDASLATRSASYNVRGDIAKEWQPVTNADGVTDVLVTIHEYDALGHEITTIQPQRRVDVGVMGSAVVQSARWYQVAGGAPFAWVDENILSFSWPEIPAGRIRVEVNYVKKFRDNASPALGGFVARDFTDAYTGALVRWYDAGTQDTDNGVHHITSWQVWSLNESNQKVALLRDSAAPATGPTVTIRAARYTQSRYNAFGEMTERGSSGARVADNVALQEYWNFDSAGRVWKTNADSVDRVYLYDVAGRGTAQILSQVDDAIKALAAPSDAFGASGAMFTETLYNSLDQVTVQRQPKFTLEDRIDPVSASVSIGLVNGVPTMSWGGSPEPGVKTIVTAWNYVTGASVKVTASTLPSGVFGIDLSQFASASTPPIKWYFEIVKSLDLQFAPFARSTGSFSVKQDMIVSFNVQASDTNVTVATPVIGGGPALAVTPQIYASASLFSQPFSTNVFWIPQNVVNLAYADVGTGPINVEIHYTTRDHSFNVQAGQAGVVKRFANVTGKSAGGVFDWAPDPNAYYEGIFSIQSVDVFSSDGAGNNVALLRSSTLSSTPTPVRLRWAPPANPSSINAVFHYKRTDSSTWSTDVPVSLVNGSYEVDVNSLLNDATDYDYNIQYWQVGTGIKLAEKQGQIRSTGLQVDRTVSGSLILDPLPTVFDQYVPTTTVSGLNLTWSDPGSAVDSIEFRYGTAGSGTYPNAVTVSRSGGIVTANVDLPVGDYGYQINYYIQGRLVSQQQNTLHLTMTTGSSVKSASISLTNNPLPQPAQPVATIGGSNHVVSMTMQPQNSSTYIHPNPQVPSFGLWTGPNRALMTWPSTGSTPVRVVFFYQLKDQGGAAGPHTSRESATLTADPPGGYLFDWTPGQNDTYGGIFAFEYAQVWKVDGSGNRLALLRDTRANGTAGPPTMSWAAPADTSLTAGFFYGNGLSSQLTPVKTNGVYTVDLTSVPAGTYNYEVRYFRPNDQNAVSLASGSFTTDTVSVTMNGTQQNIIRDATWINLSQSGNNVTWSSQPSAGSSIMFQYFDGSWQQRAATTTDGINYSVDMTFLPNGTYNNMLFQLSYYAAGGTTPYLRAAGSMNIVVSTNTIPPTKVLSRDSTPTNNKWPTLQITTAQRVGNQIQWNYARQAGDQVIFSYRVNGGTTTVLPQAGAGPNYAVTIPELNTDGTKNLEWWIEYRSGSPGSARAAANGRGTITVSSTTTYPVTTLLSANDVYPTAQSIAAPYQLGGAGNILHWDATAEAGAIIEFRLDGGSPLTLLNIHEVDLTNYSGLHSYEITFRRPAQSLPYARGTGTINVSRTPTFGAITGGYSPTADVVTSTVIVTHRLDRWGNVLEDIQGAHVVTTDVNNVTTIADREKIRTKYSYNVLGGMTQKLVNDVFVTDTREVPLPVVDVPIYLQTITSINYYDMLGRAVGGRDENNNVNAITLNRAGQVTDELHADLGTKSYIYDGFGRMIQATDEVFHRTRTTYDNANRQASTQAEWAPEVWLRRDFTYDQAGRRIKETSGEKTAGGADETTTYYYDLAGNLLKRRSQLGAISRFEYDIDNHKVLDVNSNGDSMRFENDHFGRTNKEWDLAGELITFDYNGSGALDSRSSSRGQSLDYQYDAVGHLSAIVDTATNRHSNYGYNIYGQQIRERTTVNDVLHQDTQTEYDKLDRITRLVDLRYSLNYYYDAHGNRTLTRTRHLDHELVLQSQDLWFQYDVMNRVTLSQGYRDMTVNEFKAGLDGGVALTYFANGQRQSANSEIYEYDGANRLRALWKLNSNGIGSTRVEVRDYDGASRLIRQSQTTSTPTNTKFVYDDDGTMTQQVVRKGLDDTGLKTQQTDYFPDSMGVQRGYKVTVYWDNSTVKKDEYFYTNSFRNADSYLLTTQNVQQLTYNSSGVNTNSLNGSIQRQYDVNNDVVKIVDAFNTNVTRHLANNLRGEVITAIEGNFADDAAVKAAMKTAVEGNSNLNNVQHFFHAHDQSVGSLGQITVTQGGQPTAQKRAKFYDGVVRPVGHKKPWESWATWEVTTSSSNFDVNYTEASQFQQSPSNIVVQQGDTLRSVATRVFGDGNLWYLLAEQNGLTQPDVALQGGTTLRVPNQVYSLANTSNIFKPFDPSTALDKQASMIDPMPPVPKAPCGGLGQLILMVIAVIVTAVVAYYLGPAAGPVAAFFQGLIAGAAGSIVSQGVGVATGIQDKFDWNAVALSALAGGISGGVAKGMANVTEGWPTPVAGLVKGAISNALTQGASIALGLQDKFSWRNVAMSATSGAATAAVGEYATKKFGEGTFAADATRNFLTGAASAVVTRAFGGKVDVANLLVDAFGNAIGNSIGRATAGPPKLGAVVSQDEQQPKAAESVESTEAEGASDDLSEVIVTAQRRSSSIQANPESPSLVGIAASTPDEVAEDQSATERVGGAAEEPMEEIVVTGYRSRQARNLDATSVSSDGYPEVVVTGIRKKEPHRGRGDLSTPYFTVFPKALHDDLVGQLQRAHDTKNAAELKRLQKVFSDNIGVSSMQGYPVTPQQLAAFKAGDTIDYWKWVYDQSNGKQGRTELIGWRQYEYVGASWWERKLADFAWDGMSDAVMEHNNETGDNLTMEQLGREFMAADIRARSTDSVNTPFLLSPTQRAGYHHEVLLSHGMDPDEFGGTYLTGSATEAEAYSFTWDKYGDVDRNFTGQPLADWPRGTGSGERYFGPGSNFSDAFAQSNAAQRFQTNFYNKRMCTWPPADFYFNEDYRFTWFGTAPKDLNNLSSQQMGSYQNGVAVVKGDTAYFRVVNTMGRHSALFGNQLKETFGSDGFSDIPSPNGRRTPYSNIDITVEWAVKLKDLKPPGK